MLGWSIYTKAGYGDAQDIKNVQRAYEIYYAAALVEKAAWLSYVANAGSKDDMDLARQTVADARGPLLDLLAKAALYRSREVAQVRPAITAQDVEWAFAALHTYESYGIPERAKQSALSIQQNAKIEPHVHKWQISFFPEGLVARCETCGAVNHEPESVFIIRE